MSQLEICRKFLKAVLPKLDFTKIKVVDQSHLKTDYLSKAGRLDIHCTDAYGNQFDIELQMANEHNVAQRAVGHYQMISEEGDYLNYGTHTLILNASGDWEGVSDELKGIFQLVLRQPVSHGQLGAQIMNKIDEIKYSKTGGRKYMELTGAFWQDARNEGKKAGIKIGERRGKKEGTDETIIKLIPDLFALSNDRQAVIKILMNKMGLGQEQAESYYQRAMAAEPKEK
ncbi:PD-(D/E)XK nuclease family transposase [Ligilactobacillus agilis]|uniref:PD-(D/E)XK nuclease family transposase n=1 Tax=Ligilactobacillus agilis TaxID=1601 RepID=UPI0022E4A2C6|nr:PD-(D/E)XK nuclease family transposase [Ligilactobacillus agilis]